MALLCEQDVKSLSAGTACCVGWLA